LNSLFQTKALLKRMDIINLAFILIAVLVIFYPVFYAEYLYTDEATQVWLAEKGVNLTSIPQGRWLTYRLFTWLFSLLHTTHAVIYARLFSLAGWMICLPAWYYITRDLIVKNNLSAVMLPLSLVYLVSMPSFAISIGWAACLEMFIACTCGLISGYVIYVNAQYDGKKFHISIAAVILSGLAGIISLFIYQNGFGCFFIPFFIQFAAKKKFSKNILIGIGSALLLYGLYYLLFKWSLWINNMEASSRCSFSFNPVKKLFFLLTRPLAAAFHFTWLFNERSTIGEIIYIIIFSFWFVINYIKLRSKPLSEKLAYFTGVIVFIGLIYLPSLIVAENYPSNRTLFALNLVVFILVAETIFSSIKRYKYQYVTGGMMAIFFLINAWYNFHVQFLNPLTTEYGLIKKFISQNYTDEINTVYFIRPPENAFEKKYGTVASWDEFGVPSTAKSWVPESLIKQMIFEKTGSRQMAENIIVKSWAGNEAFIQSGDSITKETLLINVEKMLEAP